MEPASHLLNPYGPQPDPRDRYDQTPDGWHLHSQYHADRFEGARG